MQSKQPDVQALLELANGWREVSRRSRYHKDRLLRDDDPGPHTTAIQLEWAARKIDHLRQASTADVPNRVTSPSDVMAVSRLVARNVDLEERLGAAMAELHEMQEPSS